MGQSTSMFRVETATWAQIINLKRVFSDNGEKNEIFCEQDDVNS
jgi:hypothetical protein